MFRTASLGATKDSRASSSKGSGEPKLWRPEAPLLANRREGTRWVQFGWNTDAIQNGHALQARSRNRDGVGGEGGKAAHGSGRETAFHLLVAL
ncbi:uncharacterized protein SPSK_05736 [Sporothrix schenckii 1099-18]|uniref:Uncharacterized protein n=1 Tax=Sporothrix schenckii 1099-18 TaxID=1397361 RepID=A0A0F2LSS6_SPOSC|nr:uncharacterized protein SPSK_05736 [Sporothrix schenckii 1099-18]KJR80538.1 hypothetical protein SPSK_05736 [Sporothrix schenckii 1099-18]